ncbi:MAG TPA: LemA family protein [Actinomycetota bacterium]
MSVAAWIALGVPVALLLWVAASYNRFVQQRNLVTESWSNVDTELRRRYDLIPNLVETVKGYAAHERALLEQVTAARAAAVAATGPPSTQAPVENEVVAGVRALLAVAEGYPDLKASDHFLELQRELANTEDRIQAARRFYNANVRDLNRRVQSFPSMLIARWFGFSEADYFEIEEAIHRAPAPDITLS